MLLLLLRRLGRLVAAPELGERVQEDPAPYAGIPEKRTEGHRGQRIGLPGELKRDGARIPNKPERIVLRAPEFVVPKNVD